MRWKCQEGALESRVPLPFVVLPTLTVTLLCEPPLPWSAATTWSGAVTGRVGAHIPAAQGPPAAGQRKGSGVPSLAAPDCSVRFGGEHTTPEPHCLPSLTSAPGAPQLLSLTLGSLLAPLGLRTAATQAARSQDVLLPPRTIISWAQC